MDLKKTSLSKGLAEAELYGDGGALVREDN